MKYATVCSGIEACTVAWEQLGWEAAWFSEIDKFPSAVLAHHYPNTPNLGDMTKIHEDERFRKSIGTVDVICGGTPCQSFSIAGLRKGLDDPRGNLALTYLGLVDKLRPKWVVWENVPGVLSSDGGRDFGTFLAALGKLGYGWAYRVLDAQYFGVPQRRRRVFVVAHSSGDWRCAAAVLFERESLRRDSPPGKTERESAAAFTSGSFGGYNPGVGTLRAEGGDLGGGSESLVIQSKWGSANAEGSEGLPFLTASNGAKGVNNQTPLVYSIGIDRELNARKESMGTLKASDYKDPPCVLYSIMPQNSGKDYKAKVSKVTQPLMAAGPVGGNQGGDFIVGNRVRRLAPIECERLQGFPDNYTKIPYRGKSIKKCPDGPRYKGIGNSMAVPVMKWIGERIDFVEQILNK